MAQLAKTDTPAPFDIESGAHIEIDYQKPLLSPTAYRLQPSKGWVNLQLSALWQYRELLFFLTWRDIVVRYKQTILGAAWAIIQPFMTMVVFSLFFGRLAGVPSDGLPYPIFSFAALLPWTFFANGLAQASNALVGNANMIKKIYFPRLIIPISAVMIGLPDFALAFLVMMGMMVFYGVPISALGLLALPLLVLLAMLAALGVGLWLSALNVRYRDVRYIVPFLVQLWMYASPVAYPSSLVPEALRPFYALNPMVGVIDGFRWALLAPYKVAHNLPAESFPWVTVLVSALMAGVFLFSGIAYFRRVEKTFADVV
jgi:lipopolysaccharide transport system permease protein